MKLINKMFKPKTKSYLKVRFSKSQDQWQVYNDDKLLYVGTKDDCLNFMDNQIRP